MKIAVVLAAIKAVSAIPTNSALSTAEDIHPSNSLTDDAYIIWLQRNPSERFYDVNEDVEIETLRNILPINSHISSVNFNEKEMKHPQLHNVRKANDAHISRDMNQLNSLENNLQQHSEESSKPKNGSLDHNENDDYQFWLQQQALNILHDDVGENLRNLNYNDVSPINYHEKGTNLPPEKNAQNETAQNRSYPDEIALEVLRLREQIPKVLYKDITMRFGIPDGSINGLLKRAKKLRLELNNKTSFS